MNLSKEISTHIKRKQDLIIDFINSDSQFGEKLIKAHRNFLINHGKGKITLKLERDNPISYSDYNFISFKQLKSLLKKKEIGVDENIFQHYEFIHEKLIDFNPAERILFEIEDINGKFYLYEMDILDNHLHFLSDYYI